MFKKSICDTYANFFFCEQQRAGKNFYILRHKKHFSQISVLVVEKKNPAVLQTALRSNQGYKIHIANRLARKELFCAFSLPTRQGCETQS